MNLKSALTTLAAMLALAACQLPGATPPSSCTTVHIDWANFVQVGSTQYVAGIGDQATLKESDLGPIYSHVKFKVSGNVCDPHYQVKDGDAAFLAPGTALYAVNGQSPQTALAAKLSDRIVLYGVLPPTK